MNSVIKNIKQQYFTLQNINFICEILNNKYNVEINKDKLFKIQNDTFNNFLNKMYDKNIDVQQLNNILVELNKLTIQLYLTPENSNIIEPIPNQTQTLNQITDIVTQSLDSINLDSLFDVKNLIKELVNEFKNTSKESNDTIKEIKDILNNLSNNELNKQDNDNNNKDNKDKDHKDNDNNKEKNYIYLDLYSITSKYNEAEYNFIFDIPVQNFTVDCFKIYSNDMFNNINEHNNKIQLIENDSKTKIIIPQGNYSIQELVDIIEKLINGKSVFKSYKILYDKNKNRIQISNEKIFNITFIESGSGFQLKDILGYSKNEYNSNSNYSSESEPNNNVLKEIYVKSDNDNMNIFYTNLNKPNNDNDNDNSFKYFYRDINEKISFNLTEPIYKINLQLYYKLNNKIIKFVKKIDFNIVLKVEM
jgi:hypothetical protein